MNEKREALIMLLADLTDRRSKEEKAESVGYHGKHVYRLLREDDFKDAVVEQIRRNLGLDVARVFSMLVELAVEDRNVRAAELLLRAAGHLPTGPQTNVVTNVKTAPDDGKTFLERLRDSQRERDAAYQREIEVRNGQGLEPEDDNN